VSIVALRPFRDSVFTAVPQGLPGKPAYDVLLRDLFLKDTPSELNDAESDFAGAA
jgi:hypothetical protein